MKKYILISSLVLLWMLPAVAKKSSKKIKKDWNRVQLCTITACQEPGAGTSTCSINFNTTTIGKYKLYKNKKDPSKWGVYVKKKYRGDVYFQKWIIKNVDEAKARKKYKAKCQCKNFTTKDGYNGAEATKCTIK